MKKLSLTFAIVLFVSMVTFEENSDTDNHNINIGVETHALIDVFGPSGTNDTDISLNPTAPTTAGGKLDFNVSNNSLRLHYSSIVGAQGNNQNTNSISVQADVIPAGLELKVEASSANGNGAGTLGAASSVTTITTTGATTLITGIGSCYTGSTYSDGHTLTYSLVEKSGEYASITATTTPETTVITYTITEN